MDKELDYGQTEERDRKKARAGKTGTYIFLTFWALVVLFPFYWMLLTSVKSYGSYNAEHIPKLFTLSPTLQNYADAFISVPLGKYLLNTLIFTVVTTALMMVVITLAAYAFARLSFPGKNLVFTFFLSLMMIPAELVMITNYATITQWGMRNSFAGLVLPSVTSVFYIYSNGIQEIRENGFGRENIPAMMAAVVVISVPLIVLFLVFRKKIMAGVSQGGVKG